MRYFKTSNASRPYKVGALAFNFDPVEQIGGIWSGVLVVEDNSAANTLAGAAIPQVTEITEAQYLDIKKKPTRPLSSSFELPKPPEASPQPAPVAQRAAQTATTPSASPAAKLVAKRVDPPEANYGKGKSK
jgi:hypothetical protein